ncbi:unnamed protein product [Owenia fusiformis]|uniref:Ataxin-10 n=1 Tax=Owenia fusiformis TaxID=6347 RepID=A0A8J1T6P3_OWEFU|nr:unnamed protein product [Owenia fusiformis]
MANVDTNVEKSISEILGFLCVNSKYGNTYTANNVHEILKLLSDSLKHQSQRENMSNAVIHALGGLLQFLGVELQTYSDGATKDVAVIQGIAECFRCLRNSCVQCDINQNEIGKGKILADTIQLVTGLMNQIHKDEDILICVRCAMQFMGNLVTNNNQCKQLVWKLLDLNLHRSLLQSGDTKLCSYSCMVLHNVLDDTRCNELILDKNGQLVLKAVINIVQDTESEWGLFIIERCLQCQDFLEKIYCELDIPCRSLMLDVIESSMKNDECKKEEVPSISPGNVTFLSTEFIICVKYIEGMTADNSEVSQLVLHILEILCLCSSSRHFSHVLQAHTTLLGTVIDLLKNITELGKQPDSVFSCVNKLKSKKTSESPAHGVKCSLIQLIANLVHKNKANQNMVKDTGGLELIMNLTKIDGNNPFITEWAVLALRNLCEDNPDIRSIIANTTIDGVANKSEILKDFGIEAEVKDKKLLLKRPNKDST